MYAYTAAVFLCFNIVFVYVSMFEYYMCICQHDAGEFDASSLLSIFDPFEDVVWL